MKRKKHILALLSAAAFIMVALSCSVPGTEDGINQESLAADESMLVIGPLPNIITDVGQVRFIKLEGGFWGIQGSKANYEPVNLPKAFCVDGLWVMFQAEILKDTASIYMWGTPIRIIKIERIQDRIITDAGIIKQVGIQGNPFIIEATKGTYQPINLPEKYQVPGLRVKFTARLRPDIIIIPNLWPIIEIISIEPVAQPVSFKLGEEFKLPVTQAAYGTDAKIVFVFESVVSDSRCPSDVVCIWAGEATVLVNITIDGTRYGQYKLSTLPGSSSVVVGGYNFTLTNLSPYPVSTAPIRPLAYVGSFIIDRVPQPTIPFYLGQQFKLPEGKTAFAEKPAIRLTFDDVILDNRCPIDVVCIQAGEAVILVSISINGVDYGQFKMGTRREVSTIVVGSYTFSLIDLFPYPSTKDLAIPEAYTGVFLVNFANVISIIEG